MRCPKRRVKSRACFAILAGEYTGRYYDQKMQPSKTHAGCGMPPSIDDPRRLLCARMNMTLRSRCGARLSTVCRLLCAAAAIMSLAGQWRTGHYSSICRECEDRKSVV